MINIRQINNLSFKEVLNLLPTTKLEEIFDHFDFTDIVNDIKSLFSNKGSKGYEYQVEAIFRAFLAQQIEQIPSRVKLIERLKTDFKFKHDCGFHILDSIPSEATFSRYFSKINEIDALERFYYNLIDKAINMEVIDTTNVAIDASALESYERAKPRKKVDKDNSNTPDWGSKQDSHHNQLTWFGWKIHMACDTKSELPLVFDITPANETDHENALPLIDKLYNWLKNNGYPLPTYWVMDSGYDVTDIYEEVNSEYNAQAIIPINKRNAKLPPAGFYDFKGTPICSDGHKMIYWGHDDEINQFRCPHVLEEVNCSQGSIWCSNSNYGLVVETIVEDNPRYVSIPHRDSKDWKEIYNTRTSIERTFSRLKENLNIKNLKVRGKEKVKTYLLLNCICLMMSKIISEKKEISKQQVA